MSYPVQQNIPDEFDDELDLPEPGGNKAAVAKARAQLGKHKGAASAANAQYNRAKAEAARQTAKLGKKGLSIKEKAAAANARKRAMGVMASSVKARDAAVKAQTAAQGKVYEANGQFDKLLKGANRDAYMALKSLFSQYGLGSLAGKIFEYVKQGYGADTIGLLLQDTKEYKERFAANEVRAKAGLPVLNPAEYLSAESAYRQILNSAGLPKGFYDNPADFRSWIAGDVSPTEIKGRVDLAVEATQQANPSYKQALYKMYGIAEADLTAYFLDRKRAEPLLKKQATAAAIGAAALRRGFGANRTDLEGYATLGITGAQAEEGYGRIAEGFETMLGLAGRYGSSWSQKDAEQDVFTPGAARTVGSENAAEKGKRLKSQERAMFAGGRGSSSQGLNAGYRQT
ncbi:hypothetical protein AS594_07105 [Streptomyces agglomeratus]|uniref:Uncharacterized protein n=1 Tax=Streptomyces agglomeratus TaxID=285458 RepID=A0A1E5P415_9ACTN|nr:hypothetical protein [Streptomyces agglomeratus]OEJ24290.1 hypothetical protein AS594_07105 [Streptomyces agglomeratus]